MVEPMNSRVKEWSSKRMVESMNSRVKELQSTIRLRHSGLHFVRIETSSTVLGDTLEMQNIM